MSEIIQLSAAHNAFVGQATGVDLLAGHRDRLRMSLARPRRRGRRRSGPTLAVTSPSTPRTATAMCCDNPSAT